MKQSLNNISLSELLADLGVKAPDLQPTDLCLDARQCRAGSVFLALSGGRHHGLEFVDQALAGGAIAVLHDDRAVPPQSCPIPVLAVPGLGQQLGLLAQRFWGLAAGMDLIAVTGTNGKTSVAWLLAQALDGAMFGTLGIGRPGEQRSGTHTTPDVLSVYRELARLRADGLDRVVMEASSHALDQGRLDGLNFTTAIFTGLGHDHLDYHHDLEAYFEAKARLFTDYASQRQIINLDNARGRELAGRLGSHSELLGYSLNGQATALARITPVQISVGGLEAVLELPDRRIELKSGLLGRINLHNLAIVALELSARGFEPAEVSARIARLSPVPGRMQAITGALGQRAVVDYAHTPDALENVLLSLRELGAERIWCVFGCGGDRDRAKRPRMGRIAESLADRVILTDDNPRTEDATAIIREIQSGMRFPERSRVIRDRAAAIRTALQEAAPGDLILVAGKGHETEQLIGDQCLVFSDAQVVRDVLEEAA